MVYIYILHIFYTYHVYIIKTYVCIYIYILSYIIMIIIRSLQVFEFLSLLDSSLMSIKVCPKQVFIPDSS